MNQPVTFLDSLRGADIGTLLRNGDGLTMEFHPDPSGKDPQAIPLVVSKGRRGNASILSPTAHYLDYPLLEMGRHSSGLRRSFYATLGVPWKGMFRATSFDRVVYVNHWLLNGSPPLRLSAGELARLIEEIRTKYPEHALIFSTIVPALTPNLSGTLSSLGGRAVQSRIVHILDTSAPLPGTSKRGIREKRNVDRRLHESRLPDRVTDSHALLPHAERMHELYGQLYLTRYTPMNPQYTEEFFRMVLESGEFQASGWFDGGRLEAFNIRLLRDGINHTSICGYDTSAPKKKGLFRLLAAEDMLGAGEYDVVNWGGGNASFKKFRGAEPALEYDIVFDGHLAARRRFPWRVVQELRGLKNKRPGSVGVIRSGSTSRTEGTGVRRVALITSIPELVAPFLSTDLDAIGIDIPLAVLIRPSELVGDRIRELPLALKRQARINRTSRPLQLVNRVLYYRAVSDGASIAPDRTSRAEALDRLASTRSMLEAQSANDPAVVSALLSARCEVGLVVGADVIKRSTLDAIGLPLVNLHLSDPSFVRGMPPVFWEIHDGREEVCLTLHRLTADLDAGPILFQRAVPIQWRDSLGDTITATRQAAGREIAAFLSDFLHDIVDGRVEAKALGTGPVRTIPPFRDVLKAQRICRDRARIRSS